MPTNPETIDRMALIVATGKQAGDLMNALRQGNFFFTQIDSFGGVLGMLAEASFCLLVGFPSDRQDELSELVRRNCPVHKQFVPAQFHGQPHHLHPVMVETLAGGATVYTLSVEHYEQI